MWWLVVVLWVSTLTVWGLRVVAAAPPRSVVWLLTAVTLWGTYSTLSDVVLRERLADAVEPIAGREVRVHCKQEYLGAFATGNRTGYVPYSPDDERGTGQDVFLRRSVCDSLADARGHWEVSPRVAASVQVLTHEAMHVKGVRDEAEAECSAMQYMASAARRLGAGPSTARGLAVTYYRSLYVRMPSEYRSADCVADGGLDLGLGDGPW